MSEICFEVSESLSLLLSMMSVFAQVLLLVCSFHVHTIVSSSSYNFNTTYPLPFTKHNRILSMILSYDLSHIDPLVLIVNEYVSMCEGNVVTVTGCCYRYSCF